MTCPNCQDLERRLNAYKDLATHAKHAPECFTKPGNQLGTCVCGLNFHKAALDALPTRREDADLPEWDTPGTPVDPAYTKSAREIIGELRHEPDHP